MRARRHTVARGNGKGSRQKRRTRIDFREAAWPRKACIATLRACFATDKTQGLPCPPVLGWGSSGGQSELHTEG
jgi:hypothetical protein